MIRESWKHVMRGVTLLVGLDLCFNLPEGAKLSISLNGVKVVTIN